jgi:hypothetical protein
MKGYQSDNLGDALADLNDAFGSLSGFGEIGKGVVTFAVPVVLGGGVAFGAAYAIDTWIENATVKQYKWAIAGALGAAAGTILAIVKPDLRTQGVVFAVASVATAAAIWGYGKIGATTALTGYRRGQPSAALNAYRYANPFNQGNLGAYKLGSPKAQMGNLGRASSVPVGNVVM